MKIEGGKYLQFYLQTASRTFTFGVISDPNLKLLTGENFLNTKYVFFYCLCINDTINLSFSGVATDKRFSGSNV